MELIQPGTTAFSIGATNFVIDITPGYNRRPSDDTAFTLVKPHVNQFVRQSKFIKPKTILELGVFQGGSFVFLDCLFKPDAMSGVELSSVPVPPLDKWVAQRSKRHIHYGTSQTDETVLKTIVKDEFGGRLDFVVDDASHLFDETRRSFEILFPLLNPGGYYLIEDWAWSHTAPYQGAAPSDSSSPAETSSVVKRIKNWARASKKPDQIPAAPHANKPAMSNLIFEIIALHGSTNWINEIQINRSSVLIRKSPAAKEVPENFWSAMLLRGKKFNYI